MSNKKRMAQLTRQGCGMDNGPKMNPGRDAFGGKIMEGTDVDPPNMFPWFALLKAPTADKKSIICGGSLITKKDVVSAAHCKFDEDTKKLREYVTAFLGVEKDFATLTDESNPYKFDATEVSFHPDFDKEHPLSVADLAVYHLKDGLEKFNDMVRPICLPIPNEDTSGKLVIIGFGMVSQKRLPSPRLQIAKDVRTKHTESCNKEFRYEISKKNFICGQSKTAGHCKGDSGGPLMKQYWNRWVLIGVISSGIGDCNKGRVNAYANVLTGTEWIKEKVKGDLDLLEEDKKI